MALPGLGAVDAILQIKTEEGDFLVLGMTGHEHLGRMYEYTVELAGALDLLGSPEDVDLQKLLGTKATLTMTVAEDPRYFSGHVTRAKRGEKRGRYQTFTLTLQPWLWFATRTKNSRVFQEKSVKEIVTEVLKTYGTDSEWRLESESDYKPLDYCVQYNETDFDFVSRLLEEVGIYYFFEHSEDAHTMVLIDAMAKHKPPEEAGAIKWANAMQDTPTITNWHVQKEARSAKVVLTDFDYLAPATEIEGEAKADKPPQKKLGELEWFEHPALVVQNSAKEESESASSAVSKRAEVRMEELISLYSSVTGATNVHELGVGMTFELEDAPNEDDDAEYLMVSALYRLDFADHEAIEDLKEARRREGYHCDFLAMNTKAPNFRPPRITRRPIIAGPQTAVIVAPTGDGMYTDKYGRVKIQFHWDRLGANDEKSSGWVRVAQAAGHGHGTFSLPRIGDEVVVQFLDGNPDRPLVTGSVYNADRTVAWKMPDHATVSGFKTSSTDRSDADGDAETANELRFEDKKDSEYIWLQAQKNFHRRVKNDAFDWVGNNESVKVVMTRNEAIGENWLMDITKDVMHHIGQDLHLNVEGDIFFTGGATWQLKLEKDFNVKLGGDFGLDVSPMGKIQAKAMNVVIEATAGITLKCGGSIVNIGPAGVDIVGAMVKVNSGGGGGSASPAAPAEAKKEEMLTMSSYDDTFEDPMPKSTI